MVSGFAQAEVAAEGMTELLKFGVLGIFCILLMVALVWLVLRWKEAMEQRVADAQAYATGLQEINDAGNRMTTEVKTSLTDLTTAHRTLRDANATEHSTISTALNNLRERQVEFIAEAKATKAKGSR